MKRGGKRRRIGEKETSETARLYLAGFQDLRPSRLLAVFDSCAFTTENMYSVPVFFSSGGTHDLNLAVRQFILSLRSALLQKKFPSVLPFVNRNYIIVQLWFGPEKFETTSRPLGITCSEYACHLTRPQFWRNCRLKSQCCTVNRPLSY